MKSSKEILLILTTFGFINGVAAFAQGSKNALQIGGIYLSYHDYHEGTPSILFSKIKLNDFLSSKYIQISMNRKKIRLNKDSIFGYRNCKNQTYRFYKKHDEEFEVLESKSIVVYKSYVGVASNNGKTNKLKPAYFFSKTESSEILPLTMDNLKQAFPDNIKFHDMLTMEFGNGELLSAFSTGAHMYKVNYLLNKSNQ